MPGPTGQHSRNVQDVARRLALDYRGEDGGIAAVLTGEGCIHGVPGDLYRCVVDPQGAGQQAEAACTVPWAIKHGYSRT